VCDLACGRGDAALEFAREGKAVFAVDFSPAFCRTVRERAKAEGLVVRVIRADMRSFRLPRPVDLVVCEFAALNNLARREDLPATLAAVARALRPGGMLLCDVNTPLSFETQAQGTYWTEHADFKNVIRGVLEAPLVARLECEWFVPAGRGLFRHVRETYRNVGWTERELRAALKDAGFRVVRAADGADVRPPEMKTPRGTDLYLLARKKV
jgi:SAM-dependent methyltransferase